MVSHLFWGQVIVGSTPITLTVTNDNVGFIARL